MEYLNRKEKNMPEINMTEWNTVGRILQGYTVWLKLRGPFKDEKRENIRGNNSGLRDLRFLRWWLLRVLSYGMLHCVIR